MFHGDVPGTSLSSGEDFAPNSGGQGSIPRQESRSHMLQVRDHSKDEDPMCHN